MSLQEQLDKAKKELNECVRPFFLFDDDPDGLASFLLLYKMIRGGKGMAVKGSMTNERMLNVVKSYQPDLIIILDKPVVEQDFFDEMKTKCVWIDHHEPQDRKGNITYVNPRVFNPEDNQPTSLLAYKITNEDAWIATVGIVADWQLPPEELRKECEEICPGFISSEIQTPQEALFASNAGKLARVFSFNLKGKSSDVLTTMKILSRIKNPSELLNKEHSQAKLLMKKYEQRLKEYEELKSQVEVDENNPVLLFKYNDNKNSYTVDLSNELLYSFPDKLIIIARQSGESYKCSLRSSTLRVNKILEETLAITGGNGGGHEHACGAVIENERFEDFVKVISEQAEIERKEIKNN